MEDDCPTNIIDAAKRWLVDVVEEFIQNGADLNATEDFFGFTALHWAIVGGGGSPLDKNLRVSRMQTVQALVRAGADMEARCKKQRTPLIWAAEIGEPNICKYLLEEGADQEARDKTGKNFILAAANGCRQWPVHTPGHERPGDVDLKEYFASMKVDLNARTNHGYTPLHLAARKGVVPFMEILLDMGADLEARCNGGKTPLLLAVDHIQVEAVRKLLARGANPSVSDNAGVSAMALAVQKNCYVIVKEMFLKGVDIDVPLLVSNPKLIGMLRIVRDQNDTIKTTSLKSECAKCELDKDLVVFLPCRHISVCRDCSEDESTCNVCQSEVACKADLSSILDARTDCMVCTGIRKKPAVLLPCRHTGLCLDCANDLKKFGGRCPKCRHQVKSVGSNLSLENRQKLLKQLQRGPHHILYQLGQFMDAPPHAMGHHGMLWNGHPAFAPLFHEQDNPQLDANNDLNWTARDVMQNIETIEKFMAKNVEEEAT